MVSFLALATLFLVAHPTTAQDEFLGEWIGEGIMIDGEFTFPAWHPDGDALYFSRVRRGWADQVLMMSERRDDGWGAPQPLPFSGTAASDRAPRWSPDGTRLFFTSNRPLPGQTPDPRDFNVWMVERGAGGWSEPRPVPGVNSAAWDAHATVAGDGTMFVASAREGGAGRSDLHRAVWNGRQYDTPVNLGEPVNSELSQSDAYVHPDGDMMIVVQTNHPQGYGGDDLYVTYRQGDGWTRPRNLGPSVNTDEYEYGPALSPDGEYLYFTSHRGGVGRIYRIRTSELDLAGR